MHDWAICLSRDPSQSSAVGSAAVVGRVTACDACPSPVGTVSVFSGTSSLAAGKSRDGGVERGSLGY